VQSLLSAARLQAGQIRPRLDWCDMADLVRVALRGASQLGSGHPIETRLSSDLPLVRADSVLMEQVLTNLLVNAFTHTPEGTPVEISAHMQEGSVALTVADRGPGLPADQLDRIFDSFHRASAARPGGTGLGLAIVKGFVEAQGGRVKAANRPGGGAIFAVSLPATDTPDLSEETL